MKIRRVVLDLMMRKSRAKRVVKDVLCSVNHILTYEQCLSSVEQ